MHELDGRVPSNVRSAFLGALTRLHGKASGVKKAPRHEEIPQGGGKDCADKSQTQALRRRAARAASANRLKAPVAGSGTVKVKPTTLSTMPS